METVKPVDKSELPDNVYDRAVLVLIRMVLSDQREEGNASIKSAQSPK